ncbi:MAG: hypothetical protein ACJASQ_002976 [Crocinitomicaceae bacterium]|jgi:uncharacterized protein YjbI with pentapeptide repeats
MMKRPINGVQLKEILERTGHVSGYSLEGYNIVLNFDEIDTSKVPQINFDHCDFLTSLDIVNIQNEKLNIKFSDCSFKNRDLNLHQIKVQNIEIKNCNFNTLSLSEGKSIGVDIDACEITTSLILFDWESNWTSVISSDKKKMNSIHLNAPMMRLFKLQAASLIEKTTIKRVGESLLRGLFGEISLSENFERIEVLGWRDSKEETLQDTTIDTLNFKYQPFEGALIIQDTRIENLNLNDLSSSKGSVKFQEVEIENTNINDCSIVNFSWNQVAFKNPPNLSGSDFTGLRLSNVQWADKEKSLANSYLRERIPWLYKWRLKSLTKKKKAYTKDEVSVLKYDIDTYRNLKAVSISNHNQIDALLFYRNEMKLYWKLVRIEDDIPWYDRVLVFLNRWVSNFGQSWHMPLLWLLSFHFIFMMCLLSWKFSLQPADFETGIGHYFYLLNPVHKSPDFISTGMGHVTEFFMRIMGGFFIYHFIKATRKFGKV